MLTIDWQPLSPRHGFVRPPAVDAAGLVGEFDAVMERSAALHDLLHDDFPDQASYAVSLAYRVRYSMQFNAREAIHMLELRTSPKATRRTVGCVSACTQPSLRSPAIMPWRRR